jgi:hypothetical protein
MLSVFSARIFVILILLALPLIFVASTSSNIDDDNNLQDIPMAVAAATTTNTTSISSGQGNKLITQANSSYVNTTYGIKIQYPSDWKLVEHGDAGYHMLNVVAEFLMPEQSNYYDANISASHNSLRISVENYSSFEDGQQNNIIINNGSSDNTIDNQLQDIGDNRIGSIGISCPGFDLRGYNRNATLADNPAYQIVFDYTYLDNNKKATEIWTVKDDRVYIINYIANEDVYDTYLPAAQKMINSFELTNFVPSTTSAEATNSGGTVISPKIS